MKKQSDKSLICQPSHVVYLLKLRETCRHTIGQKLYSLGLSHLDVDLLL